MTKRVAPFFRAILGASLTTLTMAFLMPPNLAATEVPERVGRSVALKDPYRLVGLLRFFNGKRESYGTGSIVTPKGVLSCAHTMYSKASGFSFEIQFERGRYGQRIIRKARPTGVFVLSGYVSSVEKRGEAHPDSFARDIVVLPFPSALAGGQTISVQKRIGALETDGVEKVALGYGGQTGDGETLLGVTSVSAWKPFQPGYYKARDALLEGGMSGGPVILNLKTNPTLVAVNVSGSSILSGYRVITPEVLRLIKRHLN